MPLSTTELESKLWGAADILRGQIDSSDYKNYIFSMLFLKRLSDRFAEEVERAVADGLTRNVAERDPDEHEFFVPPEARWEAIVRESMNLGEVVNRASAEIEEANAQDGSTACCATPTGTTSRSSATRSAATASSAACCGTSTSST